MEREFPQLLLRALAGEPPLENPSLHKILDPLQGGFALLLHGLVVVGADEDSAAALAAVEECALHDDGEEPIAVLQIVPVHQPPHLPRVERDFVGKLGRGVAQAAVGVQNGGRRRLAAQEVVGEDLGSAGDAVIHGGWAGQRWKGRWQVTTQWVSEIVEKEMLYLSISISIYLYI